MVYSTRLPLDRGFDLRCRLAEGGTTSRDTSIACYMRLHRGLRSKQRRSIKDLVLDQYAMIRRSIYNGCEYGLVVGISEEIEDAQIIPQRGGELVP